MHNEKKDIAGDRTQRIAFSKILIGSTFHNGKSMGIGARSHVQSWEVFAKVSKSQAKVVEAHGDFHTVGNGKTFHAMNQVYLISL